MKTFRQYILEDVDIKRTGPNTIDAENISNLLFKLTNGGIQNCTIYTIRKNDSQSNPSKKAGMEMAINGRLGACKRTVAPEARRPEASTPVQLKKNNILRMCVTSVDGEDYTKKYDLNQRTRSFDITKIFKIAAGGEVYNVV